MMSELEAVVHAVGCLDDGHGYRPKSSVEQAARYRKAIEAGLITPIRSSWGHRLTSKGKLMMQDLKARSEANEASLRAAGLDPNKPVSEMTETEVDNLIAHMRSRKNTP